MPLSRFESLARRLVEGSFKRLLGGQLEPLEIATHLARALEDNQKAGIFQIYLHPRDYENIYRQNPRLTSDLATYLMQLAQQGGIILSTRPQIELTADSDMHPHQVRVEAHKEATTMQIPTQVHERKTAADLATAAIESLDAFLIVEGRTHIPLDRPLLTIGRRVDNDLVLDSPAISRRHAQIRWRYGRFILYDLSHRGRTAVNEQPITEHALQPGDVISLSDIPLIYAEGRDEEERPRLSNDSEAPTLLFPEESVDSDQ
jgi:hypothetical protein